MRDTPIVLSDAPPLTFPELANIRMDNIEARLATLERQLADAYRQPSGQHLVLLRWRDEAVVVQHHQVSFVQPDGVQVAIEKLAQERAAWVQPQDVADVLAAVQSNGAA
jgi:hypothetical protein